MAPNADFDLYRLLYTFAIYCFLALLGVCGMKVIRFFLALTYVCFICALTASFSQFVSIAQFSIAFGVLLRATAPEAIFDPQTYMTAFYVGITTSGLGLSGILCASSFRKRNNDSFRLSYGIIFNNVTVSIISLLIFLFVMSAVDGQYRLSNLEGSVAGYNFAISFLTEVFMVKEKSITWVILYNVCVYIVSVVTFCGPLIIICALVRDTTERHRQLWTAWAIIAFCLAAFLASVPRSLTNIGDHWETVVSLFYELNMFFVIAVMIIAFVFVYGEREYVIDLSQLYPIKDGYRPWSSPAHPVQLRTFVIAVPCLLFSTVVTFAYSVLPLREESNSLLLIAASGLIGTVLAFIVGFLAYNAYGSIRRAEGMGTLFFVTPEHPSYWRITSLTGVGVEETSEQVLATQKVH